jgi:hypothetical protein
MLKHVRRGILSLIVSIALAGPARAWNDFGHMTIAYLAYQKLTPAARDRASALLKQNPYYEKWAAAVPEGLDNGLVIFMLASLWADEIKGDPNFVADGSAGGNRPDGSPDPDRNTGFDDILMHKYRHFIDRPLSSDGTSLDGFVIPTPNAEDTIRQFRAVLASSDPDTKKSYDLAWILHLVGDVHQPLHSCTRLSSALPAGDDGGNKVQLHCSGCPRNLHAFWDDVLGTTSKLKSPPNEKGLPDAASIRAIIAFARKLERRKRALDSNPSEAVWIEESFQAARQQVYPELLASPDGSYSLTPSYQKAARTLAEKRVKLAAARLASLVNNELK